MISEWAIIRIGGREDVIIGAIGAFAASVIHPAIPQDRVIIAFKHLQAPAIKNDEVIVGISICPKIEEVILAIAIWRENIGNIQEAAIYINL
jgi:hypothetical protein